MWSEIDDRGEFCDLNTYIDAERTNCFISPKIKREETERCAWSARGKGTFADFPVMGDAA